MSPAPGSEETSTNPITERAHPLIIVSHPHYSTVPQPTSSHTSSKPTSSGSSPTLDGTGSTGSTTQEPSQTAAGRSGDDGGDETNNALRWKPRPRLGSGQTDTSRPAVKISKAKQGWGNFPLSLLHSVFSYALTEIPVDPRVINGSGDAHDIALALAQRVWLCDMRTVCSGWGTAVDSHSFWPAYTLVLDPSRQHQSTVDDLTSSTLTPSTPSFPTLFHRARSTTLTTCLACKLNHPERLGFYPANPKKITPTSRFGWAPTCNAHWSNFCIGCMMEQPNYRGTDIRNYQVLAVFEDTDTDEYGRTRPWTRSSKLCHDCRDAAINWEIDVWLKLCARGGVVRGLGRIDFTKSMAHTEYTSGAYGRARPAAYHTVERVWLMDHTRWNELYSAAQSLQTNEKIIKRVYINSGLSNRAYRHSLMQELKGDDTAVDIRKDEAEMDAMYKSWNKMLVEGDLDEEDDDEEDDEEDEVSSMIEGHLNDHWIDQLRDGAINDWLMDRVRLGFWITVSHEVLHLRQGRFAPAISVHARDYQHVFPGPVSTWSFSATPRDGMAECLGIVGLHERVISPHDTARPFLPPQQLVHELDNQLLAKLRERLMPALATLASTVQDEVEDEEEAEEVCRSMSFEEVMGWLRSPESWIRNESRRRLRRLAEERERTSTATAAAMAADTPNTPSDAGGSTVDSGSNSSPHVELVADDEQTHEGDEPYAIQIERGSEDASEGDPPCLGKRKLPPTSDEDVGERKSKQGSRASGASLSSSSPTSSSKTTSDHGVLNDDVVDTVKAPVEAPVVTRGHTPATAIGSDGASSAASPKAGDLVSTTRSSSESETIPITPDEDMGATLEAPPLDGKLDLKSEVGTAIQGQPERTDGEMSDLGANDSVGTMENADALGSQRQVVAVRPVPAPLPDAAPPSKPQVATAHHRLTPPSKSRSTLNGTDLIATLNVDALEPLLHTPIELIPYIPKTDLAGSDHVVEVAIMEAWYDSRAGLRECRCGICVRGKALEREARNVASLWLAGVEAERERVMANGGVYIR